MRKWEVGSGNLECGRGTRLRSSSYAAAKDAQVGPAVVRKSGTMARLSMGKWEVGKERWWEGEQVKRWKVGIKKEKSP